MSITIQLPQFEGPLPLLLYLIRKEEMDIMNVQIHKITAQYLEFIKIMKELDLEMAGEFIAMAATLIQIKSRMLLPQYDENGEEVEADDPRKELVQRLLEYQKYQEASRLLYERPLLGRDVWSRGFREKIETPPDEIVIEENALFALISAYRATVNAAKKSIHRVGTKLQSIAQRILEIKEFFSLGRRVTLTELVLGRENRSGQILITFLSLLELGKMGFISLFQSEAYQEIYIEPKKAFDVSMMSRVEEYDSLNSEKTAEVLSTPAEIPIKEDDEQEDFIDQEQSSLTLGAEDEQAFAETEFAADGASDEEILKAEQELERELNDETQTGDPS